MSLLNFRSFTFAPPLSPFIGNEKNTMEINNQLHHYNNGYGHSNPFNNTHLSSVLPDSSIIGGHLNNNNIKNQHFSSCSTSATTTPPNTNLN